MNRKTSLVLLIAWMTVIYLFSNLDWSVSSNLSRETTSVIINAISNNSTVLLIDKYDLYIRKLAHFGEYFILGIFAYNFVRFSNNKNKIYFNSFLICFIYALSDEFHQLFVFGRSGSFVDVLIDMSGSILFLVIMFIKNKYASTRKSS